MDSAHNRRAVGLAIPRHSVADTPRTHDPRADRPARGLRPEHQTVPSSTSTALGERCKPASRRPFQRWWTPASQQGNARRIPQTARTHCGISGQERPFVVSVRRRAEFPAGAAGNLSVLL